ncbi:NAD-dependent epimerase/dehydratase family protein [Paenibacillus sp. JX-17]|uniref:NAD-dependent epimerase/dehydratase family protein n=1 Tax=Paenibacillus lacisoli TaxID=3064525 RepID=A0ABT9C6F0_9BACL|nr:NAD-dependent epimerase/dehydratase family protein [Paenibacillus sp. JX-17]MDO7904847.1 NAD-dependent epimerase/dehydratase family protein [Paenibacillus sp. JX-17]
MKNILIMGGTRFFGKNLVERLLEKPDVQVTIATRGRTPDPFGDRVQRLQLDRTQENSLIEAARTQKLWDVVYDNICYSPDEAMASVRVFEGRVKHYIVTSSHSVYDPQEDPLVEEAFDPYTYPIQTGSTADFTYQEGKRQTEAILFQKANFPVSAVRFPIVLGIDDYTERLHFHINHVRQQQPIGVPNRDAQISFIRSDEAADFLLWLGDREAMGPVNASLTGSLSPGQIIAMIERAFGQQAIIRDSTDDKDMSPFGVPDTWVQDPSKAQHAGFGFLQLEQWMPVLIRDIRNA